MVFRVPTRRFPPFSAPEERGNVCKNEAHGENWNKNYHCLAFNNKNSSRQEQPLAPDLALGMGKKGLTWGSRSGGSA